MSFDTNIIWRRGDGAMPEHVKYIVEAAQNELVHGHSFRSMERTNMTRTISSREKYSASQTQLNKK